MLTKPQRDAVDALIRDVGINCITPYFRNLQDGDISFKSSPNDPVSVADKKAEELLQKGLQNIAPGSLFIGEETYAIDPSIIENLTAKDTLVWVTDPIDGTQNFVSGREGFGPMVALLLNGKIISSWMYDVCAKTMLSAHQGEGVMLDGKLLPPRSSPPARPWRGTVGWKIFKSPDIQSLKESGTYNLLPAMDPSIIAYGKLVQGDLDFIVYKKTACWDHLPGVMMAIETGCVCSRWNGEPFETTDLDKGLIVARSPEILEQVRMDIATQLSQYHDRQQHKA